MLSFLYRLASNFEREHGYRANLLYLSPEHLQNLRQDLAAIKGLDEIVRFLGMEIVIEPEARHPHISYNRAMWRGAQAI